VIRDKDLEASTYSADVTVDNVAPSATVAGPSPVNEGSTHTYTFTVSDPGSADTFTVDATYPRCGSGGNYVTGTLTTDANGGSFDCFFPDGPATTNVAIRVTDDDGGSDTDSEAVQIVDVANVPPTATLGNNGPVNEGSPATVSFTNQFDPSAADTAAGFHYEYNCDGSAFGPVDYASATTSSSHQCTYGDDGSYTVRARIIDQNNGFTSYTTAVTVGNIAPTVTLAAGNDLSVNESGLTEHTYNYSISDPGQDTVQSVATSCGVNGTKVTGSDSNTNTSGSFRCRFPDGSSSTTSMVSASATDSDGDTGNTDTQSVSVANVAPTVALAAGNDLSVAEGSTHSYSYTISDPGQDTVSSVATSCGANGTESNAVNGNSSGSFDCSFPDGDDGSTVSAQATDSDGDAGNTDTQSVSVNNVAPGTSNLVSPADGATTNDNTPSFDWTDASDQGADSVTYSIEADNSGCSFVSPELQVSAIASSDFTPATGLPDGTYCWRVRATDSDGTSGAYSSTRTFTIDTGRPSVTIDQAAGQDDPTNVGPIHFSAAFSEPVTGFTEADVTFGGTAGGTKTVTVTDTGDHMSFDVAVSGMTDGTVIASIGANGAQDASGNLNTASISTDNTVTYDTARPGVTINQAAGQPDPTSTSPIHFTVVFAEAVSDFSNADVTFGGTAGGTKTASVTDAGDHRTFDVAVSGMTTSGTVITSIGADKAHDAAGNGNYASTSADNTVTWQQSTVNAAPVVTITSPTFGTVRPKPATFSLSASFTDADTTDTHTCSINWDDGTTTTGTVNESGGSGTCTASHSFTAAGVYTIVVTVRDNRGAEGSETVWVVVYDASAGFVTGGGWINVAPGSYPANPSLSGRANFGFNSKYKNGGGRPTGETEFNFQVANFNFHSEAYDWLVVSSFKAQYRGTGSVNGVAGYNFQLTGYDGQISGGGGIDKFRIKITRNGVTVFDNRMGVPEDPDVADPQAISGGSIVIHRA